MRKKYFIIITVLLTLFVGLADIATTSKFRLFFFYIIPIIMAALFINMWFSFILSFVSVSFILASIYIDEGAFHLHNAWNAGMIFIIFLTIAYLTKIISTKNLVEHEKLFLEEKNRILVSTLQEREMMIRETHHRIKNNLTMLSSILNMTDAIDGTSLILKLRNRIQSFSVLYDKLSYNEESVANIRLGNYLGEIIELVIGNYNIPRNEIQVAIAGGDFNVNAKTASLFGLIINELTTNSLAHAFNDMQNALKIIRLVISLEGDDLVMQYNDNGPGFDYSNMAPAERHLGFTLIETIARQLKGTVRHKEPRSAEFVFSFKNAGRILESSYNGNPA